MSVKDLPDYTRQVVIRYEGGFIGLEELAARLGSIVPYDLRGNIVLMEDFESELTEWTDSSEGASSTTRSSRQKFSGDWSAKLYSPVGIEAEPAVLSRYFHFPGLLKCAAFARFCRPTGGRKIWLALVFESSTTTLTILVDYGFETNTLRIITTDGIYYDVDTNSDFLNAATAWYPVLVTFDLATGYYDKLFVGGREYDISSVPLFSTAHVATPSGYIEVGATWATEASVTTYVDDIIIAKNVP